MMVKDFQLDPDIVQALQVVRIRSMNTNSSKNNGCIRYKVELVLVTNVSNQFLNITIYLVTGSTYLLV